MSPVAVFMPGFNLIGWGMGSNIEKSIAEVDDPSDFARAIHKKLHINHICIPWK
jgi:hypothetical protein